MRDPQTLRCGNLRMEFGKRPYIMGILNVTPDSFSDGGQYESSRAAIDSGLAMVEAGADLLDLGGESTRPGAEPVSATEELDRVLPVLEGLNQYSTTPVSIDTSKAEVAREAVATGAAMINDVSALRFDPDMAQVAAVARVPLVLMHMRGEPRSMQQGDLVYQDLMGEIGKFLESSIHLAEQAGVERNRILLDPGIGFGKTPEQNLTILNRLEVFLNLGRPLLLGPSRKSFIGSALGKPVDERLHGTAAAVAAAVLHGAHLLRVHDVDGMRQVADMAWCIRQERLIKDDS